MKALWPDTIGLLAGSSWRRRHPVSLRYEVSDGFAVAINIAKLGAADDDIAIRRFSYNPNGKVVWMPETPTCPLAAPLTSPTQLDEAIVQWSRRSARMERDSAAPGQFSALTMGVLLGKGKVWTDTLQLFVDGKPMAVTAGRRNGASARFRVREFGRSRHAVEYDADPRSFTRLDLTAPESRNRRHRPQTSDRHLSPEISIAFAGCPHRIPPYSGAGALRRLPL